MNGKVVIHGTIHSQYNNMIEKKLFYDDIVYKLVALQCINLTFGLMINSCYSYVIKYRVLKFIDHEIMQC